MMTDKLVKEVPIEMLKDKAIIKKPSLYYFLYKI